MISLIGYFKKRVQFYSIRTGRVNSTNSKKYLPMGLLTNTSSYKKEDEYLLNYELRRKDGKYGASALCIGGGQRIAAIWELF
jgi:hypothetical protein